MSADVQVWKNRHDRISGRNAVEGEDDGRNSPVDPTLLSSFCM
jgi:hypothetical protein